MATTSIFIDTSGFFALLSTTDRDHRTAAAILKQAARAGTRLVTSDYVLSETATLLKARGGVHLCEHLLVAVAHSDKLAVVHVTTELFDQTAALFLHRRDQAFSFTDCSSFCVMRRQGLSRALTRDQHFQIAGFVPLLA
ncbi:MAG: PIN domain-containing protein [bacterium]